MKCVHNSTIQSRGNISSCTILLSEATTVHAPCTLVFTALLGELTGLVLVADGEATAPARLSMTATSV